MMGIAYIRPMLMELSMVHDYEEKMKRNSWARPTKAGIINILSPSMNIGMATDAKAASDTLLG